MWWVTSQKVAVSCCSWCNIPLYGLKNCNFKKGLGIASQKTMQKVKDQIEWKQFEDTAQGLL